jgi:DNA-binding GntR family transcriptional regulator
VAIKSKSKIDKNYLSQKVYELIKENIFDGNLEEGEKITETEIANSLGVSKTPVREALRNLIVEGLITLCPNKRMTITKIFSKDVIEVYQLRKVLCSFAVRLLSEKVSDEDILLFNGIIKKMELAVKKNEVIEYSKLADKFHILITHLSGNRRLEKFNNILHDQVHRYRIKSLKVKGRMEKSLEEHKKILDALTMKDPQKSSRFCEEHLDNALENILRNTLDEKQ